MRFGELLVAIGLTLAPAVGVAQDIGDSGNTEAGSKDVRAATRAACDCNVNDTPAFNDRANDMKLINHVTGTGNGAPTNRPNAVREGEDI